MVTQQLKELSLGELLDTPPPGVDEAIAIAKVRRLLGGHRGFVPPGTLLPSQLEPNREARNCPARNRSKPPEPPPRPPPPKNVPPAGRPVPPV